MVGLVLLVLVGAGPLVKTLLRLAVGEPVDVA